MQTELLPQSEFSVAEPAPAAARPKVAPSNVKSHFEQLDALRGIAILGVLLFHCLNEVFNRDELDWHGLVRTVATEPRKSFYLFYPITFGWAGVSLFFVLSGFVIHASFLRSRTFNTATFYWRRFWRIYPPYFAALIFCTALLWFQQPDHQRVMKQFWMHLFLVHNFREWSYYGISAPFWSLAVEMQFYALYPLLLLVRSRAGARGTLFFVLAVSIIARAICYATTDFHQPIQYSVWYNPLNLWFDWALGMYLAEEFFNNRRVFGDGRGRWVLFAALCAGVVACHLFLPTDNLVFTIASLASAILLESSLYWRDLLGPLRPFLIALGVCSYSFYLWHATLLKLISKYSHVLSLPISGVKYSALVALSLLIIFPWSYLLYITVEKTGQRIGKWTPWNR